MVGMGPMENWLRRQGIEEGQRQRGPGAESLLKLWREVYFSRVPQREDDPVALSAALDIADQAIVHARAACSPPAPNAAAAALPWMSGSVALGPHGVSGTVHTVDHGQGLLIFDPPLEVEDSEGLRAALAQLPLPEKHEYVYVDGESLAVRKRVMP